MISCAKWENFEGYLGEGNKFFCKRMRTEREDFVYKDVGRQHIYIILSI